MIVVVSRDATLPNIDTDSLYFYESGEGCQPVGYTSSFLIYMFAVTSCGTVQWVRPTSFSLQITLPRICLVLIM